jgi:hypothetical protein
MPSRGVHQSRVVTPIGSPPAPAISALHAATRAAAGAVRSAAILARIRLGSIVCGSTASPASAFLDASARVGRPGRDFVLLLVIPVKWGFWRFCRAPVPRMSLVRRCAAVHAS